jgi:hypothetical protein
MQDSILTVLITAIAVALVTFFIHKYLVAGTEKKLALQFEKANHAERQTHLREIEHLEERKKLEIGYARELDREKLSAFDEGRKRGIEGSDAATSLKLAKQQEAFSVQLLAEKQRVAKEARDLERAEYELQSKLFSVKISPFVQLVTNKGFVYDDYESRVGYQYQLLINGIPAFQPHVVVEQHEKKKEFDPAVKQALLKLAQGCAEAALATYLGSNPQFAKIAPAVIETVTN